MTGLLLAALLAPAAGAASSKPPEIGPMRPVALPPRTEWRLANGMTVVLVADRRLPMVTAALAFPGGDAAIPAEDAGLSDALAELLTDGTAAKTSKAVAEAAELYGGEISARATADALILETSALSDKTEAMFDLLAEVARSPSFPEPEVALRRENMKEELAADRAESDFLSGLAFHKRAFAGHPYAVTAPTEASIERLSRERVVAAYGRLVTPQEATLVLVGDIAPEAARAAVAARFGDWKGPDAPPDAPPVPAPKSESAVYLLDRPKSSQVSFFLGNLAAREDNPAYFDLLVLNGVLGGSFSSRLVRDIRETKGYTYGIGSGFEHRLTGSLFHVRTSVRTEVAGPALKAVFEHLKLIREKPVTPGELSQAKAYLAGRFALGLETQDGVAGAVLHQKLMRLPEDFYDRYVERLQAVTPESARRAARTFIRPEEMTIVAVGDAARIGGALKAFAKTRVVDLTIDGDPR